jgi:anion-transporting  ArsA/GET3 family ATPase
VTARAEGTPLLVVVGAGGVGKTTLAAALGVAAAEDGARTLVMTFDPSLRLKDALGVGDAARERPVAVPLTAPGRLEVSLLDARATFDQLVRRYAPDAAAATRILDNRFYRHLAGHLAGTLEYMAVERLFEVATEGRYDRVILDTPPTQQAIDFLEAPDRIVAFLDSGALRIALAPWFSAAGRLRVGATARGVARLLDRIVGLGLLSDMAEFFQAFSPLYAGFRERALAVRRLLREPATGFALVAGTGIERIPETLFFARRLREAGHRLPAIIVNQVHPRVTVPEDLPGPLGPGVRLLSWLGERDARGLREIEDLLAGDPSLIAVALRPGPPITLPALSALGRELAAHPALRQPDAAARQNAH